MVFGQAAKGVLAKQRCRRVTATPLAHLGLECAEALLSSDLLEGQSAVIGISFYSPKGPTPAADRGGSAPRTNGRRARLPRWRLGHQHLESLDHLAQFISLSLVRLLQSSSLTLHSRDESTG